MRSLDIWGDVERVSFLWVRRGGLRESGNGIARRMAALFHPLL
jgi:hypothetical protein